MRAWLRSVSDASELGTQPRAAPTIIASAVRSTTCAESHPVKKVLHNALSSLEEHTEQIRWAPDGTVVDHEYILFARSGFTQSVTEAAAARKDLQLVTIDQVVDPHRSE